MWPFQQAKQQYEAVAGDEGDEQELKDVHTTTSHSSPPTERRRHTRRSHWLIALAVALFALLALLTTAALSIHRTPSTPPPPQHDEPSSTTTANTNTTTPRCPRRQEWRTLTPADQQAYITAVRCLLTQPSHLFPPGQNKTAYADFPYIHAHVGYTTHNSAPFLPWHRWFLKIYETTLQTQCGYTGNLVYWDWTLDSDALERSPVFDAETGFGGDGEVGGEITVGRTGRCVVDGPFADVRAEYYDVQWKPHCLSRGFRDQEGGLGRMDGRDITPESIEEVLSLGDYEAMVTLMESRVHDAIPFGVAGDFETFTAPYDPLFFLHHTQLDRLWWLWQQRQPGKGLTAYNGRKQRHSMEMASLHDPIHMHGLDVDVTIADVMDVEGDRLCYTY